MTNKASELKRNHSVSVKKGSVEKVPFNAWDYVRKCHGEKCKISHLCEFKAVGPCRIEKDYLLAVLEPYNELLVEEADPILNQWLGLHLIPLYHDLIRLKMAKMAYDEVVFSSKFGSITVNPLIHELRAQMKAIRNELMDSGIQRLLRLRGHVGGVVDKQLGVTGDGELGYYEQMSSRENGDRDRRDEE
jgi:hypothetical protein